MHIIPHHPATTAFVPLGHVRTQPDCFASASAPLDRDGDRIRAHSIGTGMCGGPGLRQPWGHCRPPLNRRTRRSRIDI